MGKGYLNPPQMYINGLILHLLRELVRQKQDSLCFWARAWWAFLFVTYLLVTRRAREHWDSPPHIATIVWIQKLGFTPTHCDYCLDSKTSELSEPPPLSLGEEGPNLEVSPSDILFTSLFFGGRELSIVQGACAAGSSCIPTF